MYYCQATKVLVPARQAANKLVTHIRPKTYYRVNHRTGLREAVGEGTEIVREILVSREYYEQAISNGFQPELVKSKDTGSFFRGAGTVYQQDDETGDYE